MTTNKTTAAPISVSSASFQSNGAPTCDINAAVQPPECASYSVGAVYNFPFTGITNWGCLDVKNCGRPVDHYTLTATSPVPAIFANTAVWENQSIKPNGLSLESAPEEVTTSLLSSSFTQCLEWRKGMAIPTQAYNSAFGYYVELRHLPYMCGQSQAYLIKNAAAAAQISVTDFLALSAEAQKANDAYDVTTHQPWFSEENPRNPIPIDKYNPNSGRFSNGYVDGITYPYGAYVNQANRVFVCNSANCSSDPVKDKIGAIWTFKNTEAAPPSRRVQIDPEYDSQSSYQHGDFALFSGIWYQCTAKNYKKSISQKTIIFNACNRIPANQNITTASSWRAVGADGSLDFTQPVVASPFSPDVDWQINDFYVDVDAKKVYQCTGGALKDPATCRTKYAPNTDQWKDVTTVTKNGVTISNYDASFAQNKAQARSRIGWFKDQRYLKGDLVEAYDSDNYGLFICKKANCGAYNPLGHYSDDEDLYKNATDNWGFFMHIFEAANAAFSLYDLNNNNARYIVESSYAGFGNTVKCDGDSTSAPTSTYALGSTICDTANGAVEPYTVRVCNSTKPEGCKNLTPAQVSALPQTRSFGYTAHTTLTKFYNYEPNTRYEKNDIVAIFDVNNQPVYYALGHFNEQAAYKIAPTVPNNDVWLRKGHLKNTTPVVPNAAPVTTKQACVDIDIIPLFQDLTENYLKSGEYEVITHGEFKITLNDFVCDLNRVFRCKELFDDLCLLYTPDEYEHVWRFEPLMIPLQGAKPSIDSVLFGKLHSEFKDTPVEQEDIYFKESGGKHHAYKCIANQYQTYRCMKTDPSTDTEQQYWQKIDTTGKILIKKLPYNDFKNRATWENNALTPVDAFYGIQVNANSQYRFSDYYADKATRYIDFKFEVGDTAASDDGYVFECMDQNCNEVDPVSQTQTSWTLLTDAITSAFDEIPIIQVLEGVQWVSGTPYMKGDVICDSWGQAILVNDGFVATFKNVDERDDEFLDVYQPLHPLYYTCNLVAPKTYLEQTAKDFQHLVTFDKTTGSYTKVTAGTSLFYNGRIFTCVQEDKCALYKPDEIEGTWLLTDSIGKVDPTQVAITISEAIPTLDDCLRDNLKETTAPYTYAFTSNERLKVKDGLVCAADTNDSEIKRKLQAGQPIFKNIESGPMANLPYNMIVYKQTVGPQWVNLVTLGKDLTIFQKHIETAFASFPAFCGDAPVGVDPITSCKQDLAGFFTYLRIFAQDQNFDFGSEIKYWQTNFDFVIDKPCWSLTNSASQGFDMQIVSDLTLGLTLSDCTNWQNPQTNDVLGQFAEYKNAYYFARGTNPLPLIGARDYGNFSQVLLEKNVLLESPSFAEDPRLITLIAMWRYMSYGVNGTSGPSIHDIFTGHWTPNTFEAAAGLIASNKVNAALAVVYDSLPGNDGTWTCQEYQNKISLADVYSTYITQLGLDTAEKLQDFTCNGVQAYPRGKGPNSGLWLAYDTSTSQCQLSATPTDYHAFRSGDLKYCLADAASNGDYIKAALSIASNKKWYTDYQPNYPYIFGSLAAFEDPITHVRTCRYCLKPFECGINAPSANGDANWALCDGSSSRPVEANTQWFAVELAAPADSVTCVDWQTIQSGKIDLSVVDLVRSGTPFYVCQDGRVWSCMTTEAACKAASSIKNDVNGNFKIHPVIGVNAQSKKPQLFCADNTRYGGDLAPDFWTYDFSNLEFKNYGQVCSYDLNLIKQISRGYQYRYNTITGLTIDQLYTTTGCNGSFCSQTSVIDGTITKQTLWDNYYNEWKNLWSEAQKKALDNQGLTFIPQSSNGSPVWQYATRPATTFLGDDITPFQNWKTLPTRPIPPQI